MSKHSLATGTELHEAKRIKAPVRAASTANVSLSSPGATMDAVTLSAGDRVLLTNQTTASQNGLYVWSGASSPLTRASDAVSASDFVAGFKVYVSEGTANAGTYWTFTTSGTVTVGTTSLAFAQDGSGAGTVTSVAVTVPSDLSVSGSPITTSGTIAISAANQSANTVKAGPASGSAAAPTYRALAAADLPVFVASGASHAGGAVPDPGATSGTTKFLREDATWAVPAGGGGGGGGSGTPLTNSLSADVSVTTAGTFYDGPSLTLGAGRWVLIGEVFLTAATSARGIGKLWDGSTGSGHELDSAETAVSGAGGATLSLVAVATPASSTTYKISVTSDNSSQITIKADASNSPTTPHTASTLVAIPVFGYSESATADAVTSSGTITTSGVTSARVSPAGAVTGVVLAAGTYPAQKVVVINEAVAANSVTFAASGTSNVADGTSDVIAGLTARTFVWDSGTSLWYPSA